MAKRFLPKAPEKRFAVNHSLWGGAEQFNFEYGGLPYEHGRKNRGQKADLENDIIAGFRSVVLFFRRETGALLSPAKPVLEFRVVDRERWYKCDTLVMVSEGIFRGHYQLDLVSLYELMRIEPESEVSFAIRLVEATEVNCSRYASEVILSRVKVSERSPMMAEGLVRAAPPCCSIPIPLFRLEETCVLKFRAYDTSFVDFIENAEAFLDGIELVATAVQTPAAPALAVREANSLVPYRSQNVFHPGTFSGRTTQGSGEISGLTHNQLYLLEVRSMSGYICEGQFPQYLYVCCERVIELVFRFRPCGKNPSRSLIFVRQECSGIRWENSSIELQGRQLRTDNQGFLPIPKDMVGTAQLNYPGKSFTPSVIDLSEGMDVVKVITVADQPQILNPVMHQFLDDDDVPFSFRRLTALLPSGDSMQLMTDERGRFEAPAGAKVYADDDAFGLATEPLMVSTIPGE